MKKPEVITISGGFIEGFGYGVQLVSLYEYESLQFKFQELSEENKQLKAKLKDGERPILNRSPS